MKKFHIEERVSELHLKIWEKYKEKIRGGGLEFIDCLSPEIACDLLGIYYEESERLGNFGDDKGRFEVAGCVDIKQKEIYVSKVFPARARRFTAGHEIGHYCLHSDQLGIMHKDRPVGFSNTQKIRQPLREREAEYFSACYYMPAKVIKREFEFRFGKVPFQVNGAAAYWLSPSEPDVLLNSGEENVAKAIASCENFNNKPIISIADRFQISSQAMAIRLIELGMFNLDSQSQFQNNWM